MMTTQVARVVQACFTTRMDTITRSHKNVYDKAKRILEDPKRVITLDSRGSDYWIGYVVGDSGTTYKAAAISADHAESIRQPRDKRLACRCRAGRKSQLCKHAVVAEEMRLRGEA